MQSHLRGITALLLSTVIFLMGNGLVGTLIPLRATIEGFSSISIGAMGAWYFAGFVAGCYAGPRLLSRVGHIRSFAVASALIAASIMMMPMWTTQASWFVLRGYSEAFGGPALQVLGRPGSLPQDETVRLVKGRLALDGVASRPRGTRRCHGCA